MKKEPGSKPVPEQPEGRDTSAEDAAHKKRMAELFPEDEETPESIKEERDELLGKLATAAERLGNSQADNLSLTRQLAEQKDEAAAILSRIENQAKEKEAFALEKFAKELVSVVDNLERGIAAIPKAKRDADPVVQGFEKTLNQLTAVFNKFGIKAIDPKGETFDPTKHEAISMRDDPKAESETVLEVAQKGYELNGRVIRSAKVVVKP